MRAPSFCEMVRVGDWVLGHHVISLVFSIIAIMQIVFAALVLVRMARTARGLTLDRARSVDEPGAIAIVVPVLDEEHRLGRCLEGLIAHGPTVAEILVVDGGSRDGTRALIARYAARDARVRLIAADPIPSGWNGKAWGLECGLRASDPGATWVLTVDADIAPDPRLAEALLGHARFTGVPALSIATRQELGDLGEGLLHPAMLNTLVYRYGLPGHAFTDPDRVQANGQCFLARRDVLIATDAFAIAKDSRCEDVTTARALARAGYAVGFYEAGDLVVVRMHANWRETWVNWPRSLTLRDRFTRRQSVRGLLEIVFVQALPLPLWIGLTLAHIGSWEAQTLAAVNMVLVMMRLGTLAGTFRAYAHPPWTYWLSPLVDVPVTLALIASAIRRTHIWRGRTLVPQGRIS